ncbi:MotA/TolQ/ExbB proton channel family protein [Agarivorans sp. TSD2052]|uniref:MotA/TolQ/ExbB proton channel family protein n=1 Tax=Agarivorans sp. TSD2052 TaxID=2937286 RepID=UPI00200EACEC|nr:MotA/TolQ/ExbB proton channel family protein [Agarivorans sp. TSD2052]UPW19301.1 MotA/TolQ/ExbB proton channel family protein [Agarivorans sp. TSD2052]
MQRISLLILGIITAILPGQYAWANSKNVAEIDTAINQQREQRFADALSQQQQLMALNAQRLSEAQVKQQQLKQQFADNELALSQQYLQLQQRSGQLGPVFEVVKLKAQESQQTISNSLISAEHPEALRLLDFAQQQALPSAKDIHQLAATLIAHLRHTSTISFFDGEVINKEGYRETLPLLRIGSFNIISEQGKYVEWLADSLQLQVFATQPSHQSDAQAYFAGQQHRITIDPSRGHLLGLLDHQPSIKQRLKQGGSVAVIIIIIALLGISVALYRIARLFQVEHRIRQQLASPSFSANNPLGRVLLAAKDKNQSLEELELRVDEAILNELPQLERGQSLVKLFAGIAPLLGLLGTVTGMIATFQSISLFGNGDPKLLAAGISQALVTTVLGLIAAIPLLFFFSLMSARSRVLLQLLQQKSLALLANQHKQSATNSENKA